MERKTRKRTRTKALENREKRLKAWDDDGSPSSESSDPLTHRTAYNMSSVRLFQASQRKARDEDAIQRKAHEETRRKAHEETRRKAHATRKRVRLVHRKKSQSSVERRKALKEAQAQDDEASSSSDDLWTSSSSSDDLSTSSSSSDDSSLSSSGDSPRTEYHKTYFAKPVHMISVRLFQVSFDSTDQFHKYRNLTPKNKGPKIDCAYQTLFALGLLPVKPAKKGAKLVNRNGKIGVMFKDIIDRLITNFE